MLSLIYASLNNKLFLHRFFDFFFYTFLVSYVGISFNHGNGYIFEELTSLEYNYVFKNK